MQTLILLVSMQMDSFWLIVDIEIKKEQACSHVVLDRYYRVATGVLLKQLKSIDHIWQKAIDFASVILSLIHI